LRALGIFHFSVFYSLAFQIRGLLGDDGILPVRELFDFFRDRDPSILSRVWTIPSILWIAPSDRGLVALVVIGLASSALLVANIAPRACVAVCGICFLSFVSAAQDFSSYQSDGMLLEATAAAFVLAPRGIFPRSGRADPPSRAARFVLLWECFRIYFESGIAKIASGDPSWRDLSAMDRYYENGPLPTWIGYWAQQLPRGFHVFAAGATIAIELVIVFGMWCPRRMKLATFVILTTLQVCIISTANYCFLNHLVLALGIFLVDDDAIDWVLRHVRARIRVPRPSVELRASRFPRVRFWASSAWLVFLFYSSVAVFAFAGAPEPMSYLAAPASVLAHLRLANRYGLFARMTNVRYEIEFEGSEDGATWKTYRFRYKPQALDEAPKIFAPYQPRFDWNLWFCAIDEENARPSQFVRVARATCPWVVVAEARLLQGSKPVLALFRSDPFDGRAPHFVRTTLWQYWMVDRRTHEASGAYWRRKRLGPYTTALGKDDDGTLYVVTGR
jgi:hypothetical protein